MSAERKRGAPAQARGLCPRCARKGLGNVYPNERIGPYRQCTYCQETIPLAEAARRELCARPCRLNGKPAGISGALRDFATVRDLETGLGAEWSWKAVQNVLDAGGEFRS